jgi:shikimate 5-dehydrogenase
MQDINLNLYITDTENNLNKVLDNLLLPKIEIMNFFHKNIEKDLVIFIWWNQISSSLSPFMHNYSAFLAKTNLAYILFDMTKEAYRVNDILDYIESNPKIIWANVTMPYKIEVYEILKKKKSLDESAILAWAVNTIVKRNWKIIWYNTDLDWIISPIIDKLWTKDLPKRWYILWAGWAARAAVWWLLSLWVSEITIFNRNLERIDEIINHFNSEEVREKLDLENKNFSINRVKYDVENDEINGIRTHIDDSWILINTLPLGFKQGFKKYPVEKTEFEKISKNVVLYFDIVYDLRYAETPLTDFIKANYSHIQLCNWVEMVVWQAKTWFELWTNWINFDTNLIKNKINNIS